eukprot:418702-Pelagomonas_calceolata.AAC.1
MAQRAMSLPHQRARGKLVWVWLVSGSMQPQGTRVIPTVFDFNGTSGRSMGSIDSPTYTQKDCVESDRSALKLIAQFTVCCYTVVLNVQIMKSPGWSSTSAISSISYAASYFFIMSHAAEYPM